MYLYRSKDKFYQKYDRHSNTNIRFLYLSIKLYIEKETINGNKSGDQGRKQITNDGYNNILI